MTENVFNGIVDKINKGEKAKGHKTELEDLRVGFEGEHLHVAFTKPKNPDSANPGAHYINIEATGDLEIEDGHFR